MNNYSVIIPVYRHGNALEKVIQGISKYLDPDSILLVDDGSPESVKLLSDKYKTRYLRHEENQGKGQSLFDGLNYWFDQGKEYSICLDSDGQHSPDDLEAFLKHKDCDLLIGSRLKNISGMPKDRRFSNRTTSRLLSWILKRDIEDSQCGYRRVKLSSMRKFSYRETGFAFESEMILCMAKADMSIEFTPIQTLYFKDGPSSMNRFTDTLRFLRTIVNTLVKKC